MATDRYKLGFPVPCRSPAHTIFAAVPIHQGRGSCAPTTQKVKKVSPNLFPSRKRKHHSSFFPHISHAPLLLRCSTRKLFARAARSPSAAGPSRRLLRPSHKQKMRARGIAPRTRSKSVDFSLKKNTHVGTPGFHALASAAIDGPHSLPLFFLSPFLQRKRKRKQKQIQQVRIHRSDSLRSSSRCTRLARRASSAEIYVAIATRFVRDCVEDLAPLTASMERIPRCSWHIKDHYPGVIKANRTSSHFCVFFLQQNLSPKKFDFSQKI